MGIVVHMLLYLEHLVLCLEVHADGDVERLVLVGKGLVVGIFHETACISVPQFHVDILLDEVRVEVFNHIILSLEVDDRTLGTLLVDEYDGRHAGFLGYHGVVGTEVRCDMYNTRTVFRRDIVAGNDAEGSVGHG